MRFVIVYGTTDGQTAKVAEKMADAVRQSGHEVQCGDARDLAAIDPGSCDAVMIGASLHAQGYQRRVKKFIRKNLPALQRHPSAFVSVCLAIASKREAGRQTAMEIPRQFVKRLGWRPDAIEVVAGAVRFSRYGFVRGAIMRRIARKEMDIADPREDIELTDWEAVDQLARRFVHRVEEATAPTPAPVPPAS